MKSPFKGSKPQTFPQALSSGLSWVQHLKKQPAPEVETLVKQ